MNSDEKKYGLIILILISFFVSGCATITTTIRKPTDEIRSSSISEKTAGIQFQEHRRPSADNPELEIAVLRRVIQEERYQRRYVRKQTMKPGARLLLWTGGAAAAYYGYQQQEEGLVVLGRTIMGAGAAVPLGAEFLATGQQETVKVIAHLEERSLNPQRHRSLDFGCGVGRVTHALARYFDRVDGVDLSQAMIEKANTLHSHIRNLFFHHSTSRVLPFVDETFDLVYSRLVLQHMATDIALSYIGEFVRVLRPGGVAVFQAPSRCLVDQEVKPSEIHLSGDSAFIEMHAHPPEVIERTVEDCGGRIADVRDDPCAGEAFESLKYTVVR